MVKIGFTGTHCTGKTTLVNRLHKDIPKSAVVKEVARNYDRDILRKCEYQKDILADQIRSEVYASIENEIVITDRTIIDNIAYMMYFCGLEYHYMVYDILKDWIRTYDVIFFCPIEDIPLEDDGFRFTDNTERDIIQLFIEDMVERYRFLVRFVKLNGDEEKRYMMVRMALAQYGL